MALFKRGGRGLADPPAARIDVTYGDRRAQRARLAARSGDGDTLHALIAGAGDPHQRTFLLAAALDGIAPAAWITALPDRFPDSSVAWAIRGVHTLGRTWQQVGGEAAGPPDDDLLPGWQAGMASADDDLLQSTRLSGGEDPAPWAFLVATGAATGLSLEEVCNRFDEADQRAPWLVPAHHHLLRATSPAWSGSDETMAAVAADIATRAPDGCPCHDAVVLAHLDRARRHPDTPDGPGIAAYLQTPAVAGDLDLAARRSIDSPRFPDRPDAVATRNLFAYAFSAMGDHERAAGVFRRLGERPTALPWAWDDADPGLAFARARHRAGITGTTEGAEATITLS